jgi:cell filamentation protein
VSEDAKWTAYFYSGTQVLRNLADLRERDKLQHFERDMTTLRLRELERTPVNATFDAAHVKEIHRRVFQDVYVWAGEYRTVGISKLGRNFAPVSSKEYPDLGARVIHALQPLRETEGRVVSDKASFVKLLAAVHRDVDEAHPFREGNGRVTRVLLDQYAQTRDYRLDFERVSRAEWLNAAVRARMHGDSQPMQSALERTAAPTRAYSFERALENGTRIDAIHRHQELSGSFRILDAVRAATRESSAGASSQTLVRSTAYQLARELRQGLVHKDDSSITSRWVERHREYQREG